MIKQFLVAILFATILASCNTCAVNTKTEETEEVTTDSVGSTAAPVVEEVDTTGVE